MAARKRATLERKIDQLLAAGIDCAAISTVLRCRFADVQTGQLRAKRRRAEAERAKLAATQQAMPPSQSDARAKHIAEQNRAEWEAGLLKKGAQHRHLRVGNFALPDRLGQEDYAILPRHWGFFARDDDGAHNTE